MKLISFFLLLIFPLLSEELTGKVVKVADGDTITILNSDNESIRIRLDGIDCPEKSQDYDQKAKDYTSALCAGKQVKIISYSKDRYGRILGVVMVGSTNVNKELLKSGLAWHYKQYNKDKELSELERIARVSKLGLWFQKNAIAPGSLEKK